MAHSWKLPRTEQLKDLKKEMLDSTNYSSIYIYIYIHAYSIHNLNHSTLYSCHKKVRTRRRCGESPPKGCPEPAAAEPRSSPGNPRQDPGASSAKIVQRRSASAGGLSA